MNKLSVRELNPRGERVFTRVDFNVPLTSTGEVADALPGSSTMDARFEVPEVREDLAEIGYTHALDLLDNLILGDRAIRRALADVEAHHDDRPRVEYESSRRGGVRQNWLDSFDWLLEHRESFGDYLADHGEWSAERVTGHALASASMMRAHRAYVNCDESALERSAEALEQRPGYHKALVFIQARRGPKGERIRPGWCPSGRPRLAPRPR